MKRTWRRGWWVLTSIVLAVGVAADAAEPSRVDEVLLRVGPRSFEPEFSFPRPHVAQLGAEARPVVFAPPRTVVSEAQAMLVEKGRARAEIDLPEHARDQDDASFELLVLPLPFDVPVDDNAIREFRAKSRWERRSSGWKVRRLEAGARAEIEIEDADAKQLVWRIEAIGDAPLRLESRPIDLPENGTLELGYGSTVPQKEGSYVFRAGLECEGRERQLLVDDTVPAVSAARWRDAKVELLPGSRACRLVLETRRPGGSKVPGGVWSVPRVVGHRSAGSEKPRPNIVLISLDTLRADHISGFGYVRPTTPVIDRELIGKGTAFVDATTTFPRTDVSHMSLMTSVYPSAQPERGRFAFGSPVVMLAERLRDSGYETVAFAEGGLFGGPYGFWHGFDRFTEFSYNSTERGVGVFRDGAATLDTLKNQRFFLMLHTYKTHDPWTFGAETATLWTDAEGWTGGKLDTRVPESERGDFTAYDRTIREADTLLGGFLSALDSSGLARETLVVVVSDHGEAFGEHKVMSHGYGYQQEQLHVPVLFRGPGIPAGKRIEEPISLVDVAPTLLEIAGAPPLSDGQGMSLASAFRGETLPGQRPIFFSWITPDAVGYRAGSQKIVRANRMSAVTDLKNDPLEKQPRSTRPLPEGVAHVLDAHVADAAKRRADTVQKTVESVAPEPITEQMKRSLKALGYVE